MTNVDSRFEAQPPQGIKRNKLVSLAVATQSKRNFFYEIRFFILLKNRSKPHLGRDRDSPLIFISALQSGNGGISNKI